MPAFQTAVRNRVFSFFFCPLHRLWLRSRPRGARAALGIRFLPLAGGQGLWFPLAKSLPGAHARAWRAWRTRLAQTALGLSFSAPFGSEKRQTKQLGEEEWPTDWGWRDRGSRVWRGVKTGTTAARPLPLPLSEDCYPLPRPQSPPGATYRLVGLSWPHGCARLPGGEDNPGPSQQVRAPVRGRLVACGAARSAVIAAGLGTFAASDKVRSSTVLAHLLLRFKRGPVRALELWRSPLTLLSFSCPL